MHAVAVRPRHAAGTHGRSGASLTEVLISILVTSIGVVSLASLFPIAIVRSVQATQLNHATTMRLNAEEVSRMAQAISGVPQIMHFHDPDGSGPLGVQSAKAALTRWVVDPYGWLENFTDGTGLHDFIGNDGGSPPAPVPLLRRLNGGLVTTAAIDQTFSLPDSWVAQFEDVPVSFTANSVTFDPRVSLAAVAASLGTVRSRVVLLQQVGRSLRGEVREITNVSGSTVSWNLPLPGGFVPEQVRVETFNRRYTWMATVRYNAAADLMAVDVAVFFNRSLPTLDDEIAYTANFTKGSSTVTLDWTGFAGNKAPLLRRGGWILDLNNAYWYRIEDFQPTSSTTASVTLQTPARASSPGGGNGRVVIMRGVVDVFPIGSL
ncbi:MAG: hypothetical protein D6725_16120 [Planctomycetota bacterium]|nr:MAG: hypothetical protein D6725_16120 [Planctomycetota bacterium]